VEEPQKDVKEGTPESQLLFINSLEKELKKAKSSKENKE
jgi:hypothetical protein